MMLTVFTKTFSGGKIRLREGVTGSKSPQLISGRVGTSLQPGFPKLRPDRETIGKKNPKHEGVYLKRQNT